MIDFAKHNKKFSLSLHYNGVNSNLFLNGTKIHKFKAEDSEINAILLCLRNISKYFLVDNIKKTGLIYDFDADYDAVTVDDMLDFHKYLIKENVIK